MRRVSRKILLGVAIAIVFSVIWQKVHIWINIRLSGWSALAIFGVLVLGLFLVMDHLFNAD